MSRRERKLLRKKGKKYRPDKTIEESKESHTPKEHAKRKKRSRIIYHTRDAKSLVD